MGPSNELFLLVQSLGKAEKRQFRRYAERSNPKSSNNYVRLFDAISQQEEYDEAAIKKRFEGEKFIRNFSVAKAYLYDTLLQSLRSGRQAASEEMELRRALDHIELLHQRGLSGQARKILRRSLERARSEQLPGYVTELLRWERRLVVVDRSPKVPEILREVEAAENAALADLKAETRLLSLRARIRIILASRVDLRKTEVAEEIESLISDPLLQAPPDGLPFFARLAYHFIHASYHRLKGASEATQSHNRSALLLWEGFPRLQRSHPDQYLNALTTFLDASLRIWHFDDFDAHISKMEALPTTNERLQARAFYLGQHLQLRYAITAGQLARGQSQQPEIEAGLKQHAAYLNRNIELTLLYNLTVTLFLGGDHLATIRLANRLLNEPDRGLRQDIFDALRMFEIVSHFERSNFDVLESRMRSFQRRLRTRPREYPYEQLILKAVRQLMDSPADERKAIWGKLGVELEQMEGAAHTTGREELVLWVRYRAEGKGVEEMLREKWI